MWQDGPRDATPPQQLGRDHFAREKMVQISRGICMTPGIRASGPSYMKPVPPPVQRPAALPREADEPPMVIVRTAAMRQEIVAVCSGARERGIRPGLTLTEARALEPAVIAFDHDPLGDARALEAVARWMMRFTPLVSLPLPACREGVGGRGNRLSRTSAGSTPQASGPSPQPSPGVRGEGETRPPDGDTIYLDLTGCARVFGGYASIVRAVIDALRRLRLSAGVAVAPTPSAAWALASFGENGAIIAQGDLAARLSLLPVAALRLDDDLRESLHHLGIKTIAQLMTLPRSALPSRFGASLLLRLDQALGRIDEPLVPLPWRTSIEAKMEFEGPIESWETIWLVFRKLIDEVIGELIRRGCGARRVEVEFRRADRQVVRRTIALSRPSRDAKNLFNLIRCATEQVDGGDDGFMAIRLHVPLAERIEAEQIALLGGEHYAAESELAGLIERLSVRLGEQAIARPRLVESHLPERAWQGSGFGVQGSPGEACSSLNPEPRTPPFRPLQLLSDPIEIGVMVSPSEDRDGRPILFRLRSEVHHLPHAVGPERIAGEWWRGHGKTRDYFDVEDAQGKRFWVFRVNETNRWYVHGVFG